VAARIQRARLREGCLILKNIVAQEIAAVATAEGVIAPEAVVQRAKDPSSPLHSYFDWRDASAAHAHRLSTARQLIRSVRVDIHNETRTIRAPFYVRQPEAHGRDQGYVSILQLRSSEDAARDALVSAFARAASALRNARDLAAVLGMVDELDQIEEQIADASRRISDGDEARA
jgi:hypothetical protein